jgi:hypothetical protein
MKVDIHETTPKTLNVDVNVKTDELMKMDTHETKPKTINVKNDVRPCTNSNKSTHENNQNSKDVNETAPLGTNDENNLLSRNTPNFDDRLMNCIELCESPFHGSENENGQSDSEVVNDNEANEIVPMSQIQNESMEKNSRKGTDLDPH